MQKCFFKSILCLVSEAVEVAPHLHIELSAHVAHEGIDGRRREIVIILRRFEPKRWDDHRHHARRITLRHGIRRAAREKNLEDVGVRGAAPKLHRAHSTVVVDKPLCKVRFKWNVNEH